MSKAPSTKDYLARAALLERGIRESLKVAQETPHDSPDNNVQAALDALTKYDLLTAELYRSRTMLPAANGARQRLEETVSDIAYELIALSSAPKQPVGGYVVWRRRYQMIWRRELPLLWYSVIFFIASSVVGFNLATDLPEYVPVLLPQELMENILDREAWFQSIQSNPILFGLMIAFNNMKVALNCFLGGALLGVGGLVLLCFNGLHFGSVFGYCVGNGFHGELGDFVLSHGPLELSIIMAASFASLLYGRAFFMRPLKLFPQRFMEGARDAGVVAAGVIPWLMVAALFEAFVSPFHYLSFDAKLIAGLLVGAGFWAWTFWPMAKWENAAGEAGIPTQRLPSVLID